MTVKGRIGRTGDGLSPIHDRRDSLDWLIFLILGGWGSGWQHDPEDYWPRWCIACPLVLGGMSAAVISFASGHVGSRLLGDLFVRMGMTAQRG